MSRKTLPVFLLLAAASSQAEAPPLDRALTAARAALESCAAKEQQVAITIIDADGVTKLVLAADGATPRGVVSSGNKARTALAFAAPTSRLGEQVKSDAALAEKVAANAEFNVRAGGLLLVSAKGDQLGAVGVGGAHGSEKDEECAQVAAALLAKP
jgi:uncharacterized protein GlcG (DUF336 family)